MKRLKLLAGVAVLVTAGAARADVEDTPLDPLDPIRVVSPLTIVQGDGIKVGDGTAVYPQVGLETGYASNTFYQADNPQGAGILRLLVSAGLGSLSKARLGADSGDVVFDANGYAAYDRYLSSNNDVTDQSGLGLGFNGNVVVHPKGNVSFEASDKFDRILRPTNYESNVNATRDINIATLRLDVHPSNSRLGGSLAYTNAVDVFENQDQLPDRMLHTLAGRLSFRLLPLTDVYIAASGSYNTGLGNTKKVDSFPVVVTAGISTALTVKTSVAAEAGYTQGFYSSGPDYATVTGGAYFEYRYSEVSAFRLRYAYVHADSINANFYRDHVIQGWLEHKVDRFGLFLTPEIRFREYAGFAAVMGSSANRDDVIAAAALGVRYQLRNWVTAAVQYRVVSDSTNFKLMTGTATVDPSYVTHEVFAGVRLAL
ncbi:MAG TPA: hypothetical protein VGM90_04805 [Kofleriaceae bacterium]|jgi:hypothetical protein